MKVMDGPNDFCFFIPCDIPLGYIQTDISLGFTFLLTFPYLSKIELNK